MTAQKCELYKRINRVLKEDYDDSGKTYFWVAKKETVTRILDEAKKDLMAGFPNNPFLKEALQKIAKEDKDNFYAGMFVKLEKWFGDAEK